MSPGIRTLPVSPAHWLWRHAWTLSLSAALLCSGFIGCGGGGSGKGGQVAEQDPATETDAEPESSSEKKSSAGKSKTTSKSASGRGEVPLDVWFENPVEESQKKGTAPSPMPAPTVAATTPAPMTPPTETPAEKPAETPAAGGGDSWDELLTKEDLQDEVKKLKLQLTGHLNALGQYNSHYKEIQWAGAELAALGTIAPKLKDKVSWADKAPHVRDLGSELTKTAKGLGAKGFEETKKTFDNIDQLLGGNEPAGLEEAEADLPFSDTASRRFLMHIIETKTEDLRANYQTADKFKKEAEEVAHKSRMLATITKVITTEGYPSADEEDYQKFAKAMFDLSMTMTKAAQDGDHDAFSNAVGQLGKHCSECHTAYSSSDN